MFTAFQWWCAQKWESNSFMLHKLCASYILLWNELNHTKLYHPLHPPFLKRPSESSNGDYYLPYLCSISQYLNMDKIILWRVMQFENLDSQIRHKAYFVQWLYVWSCQKQDDLSLSFPSFSLDTLVTDETCTSLICICVCLNYIQRKLHLAAALVCKIYTCWFNSNQISITSVILTSFNKQL